MSGTFFSGDPYDPYDDYYVLVVEPGYHMISHQIIDGEPDQVQFIEEAALDEPVFYPQYYNISPSGSGSAYPPNCSGGLSTRISCIPSDGYIKDVCPHDQETMAEPHYCQGGSTFNVTFAPFAPSVTVYGDDIIRDENEQTVQMTVPYPTVMV